MCSKLIIPLRQLLGHILGVSLADYYPDLLGQKTYLLCSLLCPTKHGTGSEQHFDRKLKSACITTHFHLKTQRSCFTVPVHFVFPHYGSCILFGPPRLHFFRIQIQRAHMKNDFIDLSRKQEIPLYR